MEGESLKRLQVRAFKTHVFWAATIFALFYSMFDITYFVCMYSSKCMFQDSSCIATLFHVSESIKNIFQVWWMFLCFWLRDPVCQHLENDAN